MNAISALRGRIKAAGKTEIDAEEFDRLQAEWITRVGAEDLLAAANERIRELEAEAKAPEEGEPEIRWVYRADGKAHIAGRPTIEDAIEHVSGLRELLTAEREVSDKLEKALLYYAHANHSVQLSGAIDWKAERARLESLGFDCVGEWPSGDEQYVEGGATAEAALAEVAAIRAKQGGEAIY